MRTNLAFAAALLLSAPVVLADATLHLRSGQDVVVQKVKVSEGCMVVVEAGTMKRIAFTDLADSTLKEYGVDLAKVQASRKEAEQKTVDTATKTVPPATAATSSWKPREEDDVWVDRSTAAKAKKAAEAKAGDAKAADAKTANAAKPAKKSDGGNVRKINQANDLIHAKFADYAEDTKKRFPNPQQAADVTATLYSDQDRLCNLVSALKPGMSRQAWESMVASNLGSQAKYQQIVQGDQLFYNAAKVIFRKEQFILVIEYDKAGTLVDWSCDIH